MIRELLKPSASVALHKHSNALVDVLPPEADSSISMLGADEKPDVSYSDIGGMDLQKQVIQKQYPLAFTFFHPLMIFSPTSSSTGELLCSPRHLNQNNIKV